MSKFFTFANVSGKSQVACGVYNDGKCGRIDFRFQNVTGSAVKLEVYESALDGTTGLVQLGADVTLAAGGETSHSFSSVKPLITVKSAADNTGTAYVRIDANYMGAPLRGVLSHKENLGATGFTGTA
jgi:hypothetical protein